MNTNNDENRRNKLSKRYPLIVYLLISLLGIVFILISFLSILRQSQDINTLLVNIGTELLGGALVFFVLRFSLLDRDYDVVEELSKIHQFMAHTGEPFFRTAKDVGTRSISEKIPTASKLDFCGYNLRRFIEDNKDLLRERLAANCEIRFLVIRDEGKAHALMRQYDSSPKETHRVQDTFRLLKELKEQATSQNANPKILIKTIDWIPSCAMYIVHRSGRESYIPSWMQVEIYAPCYDTYPEYRPVFFLQSQQDQKWFEYFSEQFSDLWSWGEDQQL